MSIFKSIQKSIEDTQAKGLLPVIIFDLDDTLIDCRHRKYQVIQDFLALPLVQENFAYESQILAQLSWERVQYRVLDTLTQQGIQNTIFGEQLFQFWRKHYFTYPYLMNDEPFPKALELVQLCHDLGAVTVYLTGRDAPGMGQGTYDSMQKLGFPVTGDRVHFILKEDPTEGDLEFKISALERIAVFGHVIAALENELPNLNAMAERFPDAAMYWRKTLYLPHPPAPHPRVVELPHFH
jgi:hypothetical protein